MDETFKEPHLRSLFRLLGHKNHYSRCGSLDFTKKIINPKTGREGFLYEEKILKGEDQVIEYAHHHNGKRNVFISRGYRAVDGSVIGTHCITFDLDPVRPKNTASSDEQHEMALEAGRKILRTYPGGYLASSGNGALLVYRLPSPIVGDALKGHYAKEKELIKELQAIAGDSIRIDATSYDQAIVKGIGTISTKGEVSFRRCSGFINYPVFPYANPRKLLERLRQIEPTKSVAVTGVDLSKLETRYEGDRSIADFNLVRYFKQSGVGPEVALQALRSNPLGRQTDEKDQARLIAKIYGTDTNTRTNQSNNYFESLFNPKKDNSASINTGFSELDNALGPLPNGELTTFAARSGFGKTTFGCTLAEFWRQHGKRVLFFSTEMSRDYILHKMVSLHCGIPLACTIRKEFTTEQIIRIKQYEQELLQSPIEIIDTFQPTLQQVQAEIIKHKPDILIFDHITQSGTHWEHIAQFARGLKDITTQEGICTVLLSMLNEPPRKQDGTVSTSVRGDVRGSQEVIFLSAIFCMLSNPYEIKGRYQPVDVLVAKNRYGISNQIVPITCDKEISKFVERISSHESNEM